MAYFRTISGDLTSPGFLPDGSILASQRTTLFDGKILNADDTDFWHTVGTGTATAIPSGQNLISMGVTSGQWLVAQSRRRMPYFSGKPQIVEITASHLHTEANVVKRVGYFSSSAVSPYTASFDGFYWENDGTTLRFKCDNLGSNKVNIALSSWQNQGIWGGYNWTNFTVLQAYFLWLGGAALVAFGAYSDQGFRLQTAAQYVGSTTDPICSSPNQPIRYEIRSSTGTGTLRRICSTVATAGSIAESGKVGAMYNTTALNCDVVGTTYALKGIKKRADRRDISIKLRRIGVASTATADAGILLLLRNPTLSGALTYANVGNFQEGTATNQTVSNVGRVLAALPVGQEGSLSVLEDDYLAWLSSGIDDGLDEYVLAFQSLTANQLRAGVLEFLEYI